MSLGGAGPPLGCPGRPGIVGFAQAVEVQTNDFGVLLRVHHAYPEREPPGECSGAPTLTAL